MATVERILVHHLAKTFPNAMSSGIDVYSTCHSIVVEIEAEGLKGLGYSFVFTERQARSIVEMVHDLAPCVIGCRIESVRETWAKMWKRTYFVGHSGPALMAASAVDTALWDLFAQQSNLPLYRFLGGTQCEVPVYATGGWLSLSGNSLVKEVEHYAGLGYTAFKMKVGHQDWRVDVERVRSVRACVGDQFDLMIDANQSWDVKTALLAGERFVDLGVKWFEEPTSSDDIVGMSRIVASLNIPIAVGESAFNRYGLQTLIDNHCGDVIQPDLARCGGIGEMMRVAQAAAIKHLRISPHMFWEISAHLVSALENGIGVEYLPGWWDDILHGPSIRNGRVQLGEQPGHGVKLNREVLNQIRVGEAYTISK